MAGKRLTKYVLAMALVAACGATGWLVPRPSAPPQVRRIKMKARQYAFDPAVLRVNQGDTLRLQIVSDHGEP